VSTTKFLGVFVDESMSCREQPKQIKSYINVNSQVHCHLTRYFSYLNPPKCLTCRGTLLGFRGIKLCYALFHLATPPPKKKQKQKNKQTKKTNKQTSLVCYYNKNHFIAAL